MIGTNIWKTNMGCDLILAPIPAYHPSSQQGCPFEIGKKLESGCNFLNGDPHSRPSVADESGTHG